MTQPDLNSPPTTSEAIFPPEERFELTEKSLMALPLDAVAAIGAAQTTLSDTLYWARAGSLATGSRSNYSSIISYKSVELSLELFSKTVERLQKQALTLSESDLYDLLEAGAIGVSRQRRLHVIDAAPIGELIANAYSDSSDSNSRRRHYSSSLPGVALNKSFLDPRVDLSHCAPNVLIDPLRTNNAPQWEQVKAKEGFEERLISVFQSSVDIKDSMRMWLTRSEGFNSNSPLMQALRVIVQRDALPAPLALSLGYSGHRPESWAAGRLALSEAGAKWPECAYDADNPSLSLKTAKDHRANEEETLFFLRKAGLEGLERGALSHAPDCLSIHSLLWKAANLLSPSHFEIVIDWLDQAPQGSWERWLAGEDPSIALDSRSNKTIDWITGLRHLGASSEVAERVVKSNPNFSFSQGKSTLRWLRERSEKSVSPTARQAARELLEKALPAHEAIELRSHSLAASAKSAAQRAPSPLEQAPPSPVRRRSL